MARPTQARPGPKIALVGPSRRSQGLGPFLARCLVRAGAQLHAVLASSEASANQAAHLLSKQLGIELRGYSTLASLLESQRPDALVIASPHSTHGEFLEGALQARLHVLCEKPLLWGGENPVSVASSLALGFHARGRVLLTNCQWPRTLSTFDLLHPGVRSEPLRAFSMRLSPISRGLKRLPDCLPHVLSMLLALSPGGDISGIAYRGDEERLELSFRYGSPSDTAEVEVRLRRCETIPRPAGYEINGHAVRRAIHLPAYAQFFEARGRALPLPDPLGAQVDLFLDALQRAERGEPVTPLEDTVRQVRLFDQLVDAYQRSFGGDERRNPASPRVKGGLR